MKFWYIIKEIYANIFAGVPRATWITWSATLPRNVHANERNEIPRSHIIRGTLTGTTVFRVFT